jgi:8-oxo-dGTP pyrophosphatase MutT (NUDIX family)
MESSADKPTGAEAGWRTLSTRRPFKNDVFAVREDEVELPGGKRKSIAYLERTAAVIIVPVTREGEIVLINHYRYPVDEWCLEVPAGGIDSPDETLKKAARRELREEVGGRCRSLVYVAEFYSANSLMDEKCHVFLAEGVALQDAPDRGAAELMETRLLPAEEALALVRAGWMMDGQCALAILLCEPLLREKGYLAAKGV